jgi:hypothetical protein
MGVQPPWFYNPQCTGVIVAILSRNSLSSRVSGQIPRNEIPIRSATQLSGTLRSDVIYRIEGNVDLSGTGVSIEVPLGGLYIMGIHQGICKLTCTDTDYRLFTSPVGGSGDLFVTGVDLRTFGTGSGVYALTDATGNHAVETFDCNYTGCASLGELIGYRQVLQSNTGRFGGTPELTLSGTMNGYRETTSIVRGISDITALFKAGNNLSFSSRFLTDLNCDLPAVGALLDFSPSNFNSEELLQLVGCTITRQGVFEDVGSTITPNIDHTAPEAVFKGNTGITNTKKYLKADCTAEVVTPIALGGTYYPLLGTMTVYQNSHISMPENGVYEVLSGSSVYDVTGDFSIEGNPSDVIDLRVTRSVDGGATYPTQINHTRRVINNISGPRDVAFIPINFITVLEKGDRLRVEVENLTGPNDVTSEIGSFLNIKEE